jgi:hypothetical protein
MRRLMAIADSDVIASPGRRHITRRSGILVVVAALLVAIAWEAIALRPEKPRQPTFPGWPGIGSRAHDNTLRETAWRAWSKRDPSIKLDSTAILFAENWREAQRTVVLLATPSAGGIRTAVVIVNGQQADRFSTRLLLGVTPSFMTEIVEFGDEAAIVAVAPAMHSVVITTATVGAPRADEVEVTARGGVLVPVAAGRTATRVVLKRKNGDVIADRVPGADDSPPTPPAPLIVSESTVGGVRVQIRRGDDGVTCRVVLGNPATEAPTLVHCPPS